MISRVESSFFARAIVCVGFKSLDPNVIPGNSAGDLFWDGPEKTRKRPTALKSVI